MSIFDKYENGISGQLDREEDIDYKHLTNESDDQKINSGEEDRQPTGYMIVSAIIVVVLLSRLFQIQIVQGKEKFNLAQENSIRQVVKSAPRGIILDKRGVWLARNTSSFRVQINPSDLPRQLVDRQIIYDELAKVLKWTAEEKIDYISGIEKIGLKQIDPIVIKDEVEHDQALVYTASLSALPAVNIVPQQIRQYNRPLDGLAQIMGYVGPANMQEVDDKGLKYGDLTGKDGLEDYYDAELRGKDGIIQAVVDSKGRVLRQLTDKANDPIAGNNLALSIDLKLQSIMAAELSKGLEKAGIKTGVAIAINPQNGSILGMVSFPSYDNNLFAHGISKTEYSKLINDPLNPLFNRAVDGTFAAGSTIKPFVAAIGLQEGVITENTKIDTPPVITMGEWNFPNWENVFLHDVGVKTAIAESNDIFFYAVGGGYDKIKGLGVDRLAKGLSWFGFGSPTGIDLPSEAVGVVPTQEWKKKSIKESWYIGDTYHMSIGQGFFLATPLQLATALSTVANGGTVYQPRIVERIVDADGNTVKTMLSTPRKLETVSVANIQIVREGMRQTVTNGSGKQLQSLPVTSAAKTGTAQLGAGNEYLHSWFECFAPYDNPTIALVVLGEKGSQENEGHTTAEPIAKAILEQYFSPDFSK